MTTEAISAGEGRWRGEASRPAAGLDGARGAGAAMVACAVASILLVMAHPDGGASHALADVLRQEASQRLPDALVHGGYVLVMAIELIGLAVLARLADWRRTTVIAAMVFAVVGAGLLSASMIVDGLVTPAIAARYLEAPVARQEAARALLVLLGAVIGALMPMGLAFQALSALAWCAAFIRRARIAGVVAGLAGLLGLAGAAFGAVSPDPMPLILALSALAAWVLAAGVILIRRRAPPATA